MNSNDSFIPVAEPDIGEREIAFLTDAARSGWISSIGPYIEKFEAGFAAYCGARHGIAVANGTVALHLALHALGIGAGDEVIVPDLTFVATAHAVIQTGATPVLVDVEEDTWCLDPAAVERALTPRTRAIIPVHLYGHPADMSRLNEIGRHHGIAVIEDAAEAHGASVGGQRVGGIGTVGVFSFYGNKLITTGEGGMVVTSDDALAARLRFLKDHGMHKERRYYHTELAFNYRMTNLQAAIGVAQLERIEQLRAAKRRVFEGYRARLADCRGVTLNAERDRYSSSFWMSSVVLDGYDAVRRDQLASQLRQSGVDSRPFFAPMSALPHLASCRRVSADGDSCPVAARLSVSGINLPSGTKLTEQQVERVATALRQALGR
jgi:perosamine synthetase